MLGWRRRLKVTPCSSKSEVEPTSSTEHKKDPQREGCLGRGQGEGVHFPCTESEVREAYLSGGVQHLQTPDPTPSPVDGAGEEDLKVNIIQVRVEPTEVNR